MKQLIKILLLVLFSIQFTNCHKYPRGNESGNHGDIIDNYILPNCYFPESNGNNEYIIKNFEDLDTISSYSCVKGQPNLDFNNYSVLGKYISAKCNMKIRREVKIDHEGKQYIYTINFKDNGSCLKKVSQYNFVIVPKIPDDYIVVFKLEEGGLFE